MSASVNQENPATSGANDGKVAWCEGFVRRSIFEETLRDGTKRAPISTLIEPNRGSSVRFVVISHIESTIFQTLNVLEWLGREPSSIWVMAIRLVSDEQIRHLYLAIREKDGKPTTEIAELLGVTLVLIALVEQRS